MWSGVLRAGESQLEDPPEVLRWQFFRGLRASKLLPTEEVDQLERDAQSAPVEEIQQHLLEQGALTPYQVRRIRDGAPTGLVLAQYKVLDEIGGGGFGQVYKASHSVMNRVVALKLMTPDRCRSRLFRDVFYREVAAVTRLNHPNVVLTFDANETDGVLFLAMEYVQGPSLHAYVTDNGPPDLPLAVSIMLQLSSGLAHAHEAGLVHRDLKPANVLVQDIGPGAVRAKVIDFGLARLHARGGGEHGTLMADPGALVGTPAFMAPEQAVNFHDADVRSDLYSLGCTCYFLLTGRLPFEGPSCRAVLEMHAKRAARPLRELRPDVPVALAAVVHRLMAKRPEDRYQTADQLCDALTALVPVAAFTEGCEYSSPRAASVLGEDQPTPLAWAEPEPSPTVAVFERPREAGVTDAEARRLWSKWCSVVEAQSQGAPPALTGPQYAELYETLVRALRALGEDSEQLRAAVEPWVTLRALQTLDRSAIAELYQTCRNLNSAFGSAPPAPTRLRSLAALSFAFLALAAGAWGAVTYWPRVMAFLSGAR
ncbi:Serine/threonine-protein kinase PrkC [Gemmata obscuriglobus]|uniref:Protein kinase domain-containing protein n=1 Tax=Gemmata obscuriglobus TaxID=114 RepID=A0A2Z3H687_9BACT|nr:serine/threonine-protein kinase [Gemmata obscuriglobus]AWM39076.1 hypothetical protein C1280_20205 [Gemmata obscuriglobus]QEG27888.1 Serine/threonine-protein kinase PrkC [Gemmata obscuriglobus]VTS05302.1 serine threonine protein kinase : Serine/threonine protein kinase OS=Planctomyces brasiliensis (strain ATCC 49424 / DSM 5305 / JCM 21570 / NBRC 103401 / IFAM 1448) GN=Plabr_2195 PE=3 SV=1: Pkinase [Gemmata obscuriglobus UQM 2246]